MRNVFNFKFFGIQKLAAPRTSDSDKIEKVIRRKN